MSEVRLTVGEAEFLFSRLKYDLKTKKWKRKVQALNAHYEKYRKPIGKKSLSRPTLDALIAMKGEQWLTRKTLTAKKIEPRHVTDFRLSEAWIKFWQHHRYAKRYFATMKEVFKLLGGKEPLDYERSDLDKLRTPLIDGKENPLYLTLTKDIEEHAAGTIRSALKVLPTTTTYTLDALKGVKKRPRGTRKGWWLKNDEITRLLQAIQEPWVLLFVVLELQCGGRPEALVRYTKTDRVRYEKNVIEMYETKRMAYTPRKFHPQTMEFVKRYISDMNIGFGARLLPEDGLYYTERLKAYGKKLGIPLLETKGAGAYILRHTFATQSCEHGVSLDVVVKQGGWAEGEVRSLLAHYVEILEEKMDRELLGIVTVKPKSFKEWIEQFIPVWEKRYGEIRKISLRK
jgi:hypothetical protein